ncbi:hypothetical protein BT96DRAFT_210423 [Gymnopus androsaceus JB14]|uniref:Uncharacterized protein n=1 Tax=Gymnopus androsaceus JB14 TaxID=1447944 RepID=A0A6A4H7T0_9AGAR|nr:hypothetical protein BT96DRAFT_210423 [Gymnopus androsaceus JB14]
MRSVAPVSSEVQLMFICLVLMSVVFYSRTDVDKPFHGSKELFLFTPSADTNEMLEEEVVTPPPLLCETPLVK